MYGPPSNKNSLPYLRIRTLISVVVAVCTFAYLFYLGIDAFGVPWAVGIGWLRSFLWAVLAFGVIWVSLWLGAQLLFGKPKAGG